MQNNFITHTNCSPLKKLVGEQVNLQKVKEDLIEYSKKHPTLTFTLDYTDDNYPDVPYFTMFVKNGRSYIDEAYIVDAVFDSKKLK